MNFFRESRHRRTSENYSQWTRENGSIFQYKLFTPMMTALSSVKGFTSLLNAECDTDNWYPLSTMSQSHSVSPHDYSAYVHWQLWCI